MKLRRGTSTRRRVIIGVAVTLTLVGAVGVVLFLQPGEPRTTTRIVTATADTYVNEQRPDRVYGDAQVLRVDSPPQTFRSYLRFDIPPTDRTAESLTVRVHVRSPSALGLTVHAVSDEWDEMSLTWATAPDPGDQLGVFAPTDEPGWYAAMFPPPRQPIQSLDLVVVTTGKTMTTFDSREFSSPPQLVLTEMSR